MEIKKEKLYFYTSIITNIENISEKSLQAAQHVYCQNTSDYESYLVLEINVRTKIENKYLTSLMGKSLLKQFALNMDNTVFNKLYHNNNQIYFMVNEAKTDSNNIFRYGCHRNMATQLVLAVFNEKITNDQKWFDKTRRSYMLVRDWDIINDNTQATDMLDDQNNRVNPIQANFQEIKKHLLSVDKKIKYPLIAMLKGTYAFVDNNNVINNSYIINFMHRISTDNSYPSEVAQTYSIAILQALQLQLENINFKNYLLKNHVGIFPVNYKQKVYKDTFHYGFYKNYGAGEGAHTQLIIEAYLKYLQLIKKKNQCTLLEKEILKNDFTKNIYCINSYIQLTLPGKHTKTLQINETNLIQLNTNIKDFDDQAQCCNQVFIQQLHTHCTNLTNSSKDYQSYTDQMQQSIVQTQKIIKNLSQQSELPDPDNLILKKKAVSAGTKNNDGVIYKKNIDESILNMYMEQVSEISNNVQETRDNLSQQILETKTVISNGSGSGSNKFSDSLTESIFERIMIMKKVDRKQLADNISQEFSKDELIKLQTLLQQTQNNNKPRFIDINKSRYLFSSLFIDNQKSSIEKKKETVIESKMLHYTK